MFVRVYKVLQVQLIGIGSDEQGQGFATFSNYLNFFLFLHCSAVWCKFLSIRCSKVTIF